MKKVLNLTLWPNRKRNVANMSGMANHRVKESIIGTHGD